MHGKIETTKYWSPAALKSLIIVDGLPIGKGIVSLEGGGGRYPHTHKHGVKRRGRRKDREQGWGGGVAACKKKTFLPPPSSVALLNRAKGVDDVGGD